MLQIISGKYFGDGERISHDGFGVLYANLTGYSGIETICGRLEPAAQGSPITSWIFLYKNEIEKQDEGQNILIRTGDDEIVNQFASLATVGADAFMSVEREEAVRTCRTAKAHGSDVGLPLRYLPSTLETPKYLKADQADKLREFLKDCMQLSRGRYKSVLSSCRTIKHAISIVGSNYELAYSMYIYAIESLAQQFDGYEPSWDDYDPDVRKKIDISLDGLGEVVAAKVKGALLESSKLKAQQRFLSFVNEHVDESFFDHEIGELGSWIRPSELDSLLKNAYLARSGYVHELRPVVSHLKSGILRRGDVLHYLQRPHLTISGLHRLALHVIRSFARDPGPEAGESINWRTELPGVETFELSPQYWIGNQQGFETSRAPKLLSGFMENLREATRTNGSISDLRKTLAGVAGRIKQSRPSINHDCLICLYWLYNWSVRDDGKDADWLDVKDDLEALLEKCTFPKVFAFALQTCVCPWPALEAWQAFQTYEKQREHKNGFNVHVFTEVLVLASISNRALKDQDETTRLQVLSHAYVECVGRPRLRAALKESLENKTSLLMNGLMNLQTLAEAE